jgi:O-antigen ligase
MIVPIVRSLQFHARFDFSTTAAYMMTLPYYKDHTIYGAALAFVTVTLGFFLLHRKMFVRRDAFVLPAWLLLAFLAIALFFSYSRAAWLSVLAAVALYVFMRFRISLSTILLLICLTGFGIYIKRFDILKRLEQTEAESNKGDVTNHIQSVTNLQTDASNKERVNRWICAYRMFLERPVSGFGPGTYQFHYGRFQVRSYMTRISTFSGNKGHAHSEYFGALAETGLPGFVILLAVFITVVRTGMKTAYSAATPYIRYATIACLLGVVTYYVHGLFNGFMDTDKIAALVFAGTAAIVRLNIANRKLYTGKISPDERPAD